MHWKIMIQSRTKNLQGKKCAALIRKQSVQSEEGKAGYFRAKEYKKAKRKG